jgi:hypothetical protein
MMKQMRATASKLEIPGRSSMSAAELWLAIGKAEGYIAPGSVRPAEYLQRGPQKSNLSRSKAVLKR